MKFIPRLCSGPEPLLNHSNGVVKIILILQMLKKNKFVIQYTIQSNFLLELKLQWSLSNAGREKESNNLVVFGQELWDETNV
jgi:hypothetical protein